MPMLTVNDLRVRYGRMIGVEEASFQVEQGEFVGIVGANGAGKSSMLNALAGAVPSTAGRVTFDSVDVRGRRPEEIAQLGMMLVPEGRQIFSRLSVDENIRIGTSMLPRAERRVASTYIDAALEHFPGLRPLLGRAAGTLSGGEQQQLVIARTLAARPRLLMLDEPSLGLAPKIVADVFRILADLRADGVTVLLVEQNAAMTVEYADRVYVMGGGRLSEADREALSEPELARAYLGAVGE